MFLTRQQKKVLEFVGNFISENGYSPSFEEIGKGLGLSSPATVHKHLTNLEQKGFIRRTWNHSRAIELVPRPESGGAVELPLLGRVAAGRPIEALEQADHIAVPEQFIRRRDTFVLKVVGSSMVQDGILDGDYIVVEQRPQADNGETVVAVVGGEATVKRLYRDRPGRIRLQPANDAMAPLVVKERDCEVRGVVVAVLRKY